MKNKNKQIKKYNLTILKLVDIILKLNPEQQVQLLKYAEELPFKDKRKSMRKVCDIPVSYSTQYRIQLNSIKNISKSGLFIETQVPLIVGEEIVMSVNAHGYDRPLKLKGQVVHASRMGVGVEYKEFNRYVAEMIDNLV